jgi:hypothetical protein
LTQKSISFKNGGVVGKNETNMETKNDLISLVCNTTMRCLARILEGKTQNITDRDYSILTANLRSEVKSGWNGILEAMKETNEAFFGNNGMLSLTLNTYCLEMANKAYQAWMMKKS